MKILSIETSCDETAAAVTMDGRAVLSSVVASQIEEHKLYGGVVPEIASRRHCESICEVVDQALRQAKTALKEIDAVAVTSAPGLVGALLVGVNYAKGLALAAKKPLIAVHHLRAHVAANYLAHAELAPPFLSLIISGGHTHIVQVNDYTHFQVLGRTRDDAAGEAYDKAARALGFSYPGGVAMDQAAQKGNPDAFAFPKPRIEGAPLDFSFSGLKTAVINAVHRAKQTGQAISKQDVAASFQATVCCLLAERTMKAAAQLRSQSLVLAGGVSANSGVRKKFQQECARQGIALYLPPPELCGDNAAMVGAQAYYEYQAGHLAALSLNALASCPIEVTL